MNTRNITKTLIEKYGKGMLLDVGAGYGRYRSMLEPYVEKYFSSDGFDTRADFVEDSSRLSHASNSFGTVLCNQVLEHAAEPEKTIREMYRVLKSGGHVIATVPFLFPEHKDPTDFRRYTRAGFSKLFEECGFSIIECKSYGGAMNVAAEFIRMRTRNPYKPKRSWFVRKAGYYLSSSFEFLDSLDKDALSETSIFYPNVYLVGRK